MLTDAPLEIGTLLRAFRSRIMLTWVLTLGEMALLALIPLFIGFAIDGLQAGSITALWKLTSILVALVVLSVARRAYDTRVFGAVRVHVGKAQAERSSDLPISSLNARLGMGRELVDFLESELPGAMTGSVQLVVSVIILYLFNPVLALAGVISLVVMGSIYAMFHRSFFRLSGELNSQRERQVDVLQERRPRRLMAHLLRLRRIEVKVSDAESILYGLIFLVLLALVVFNLWFATTNMKTTTGTIFSIVSYSWEFVESALTLPIALQSWSRLSEITQRINSVGSRI